MSGSVKRISALLAVSVLAASCATPAKKIEASYVSPVIYEGFTCQQLGEEATRVSAKATELSGAQDKKATSDAVATGIGLVLFWPALFLIKGDKTTANEVAALKGQMNAIEEVSAKKNCGFTFNKGQS